MQPGTTLVGLSGANTDFYPTPVSHPSPTYSCCWRWWRGAEPGVPGPTVVALVRNTPSPGYSTGTTNQGTPGGHIGDGEYGPSSNGKGGGGTLTAGNTKALMSVVMVFK